MRLWSFLAALLVCAPLRSEPRLVGLMIAGPRPLFCVTDGRGGPMRWLALGEQCDGYTLVSFQPAEPALVIEKGRALRTLFLSDAKTGEAGLAPEILSELAIREVRGREGWDARAHAQPAERSGVGDAFRVMVRESANEDSPVRMVILSQSGQVRGYFKVAPRSAGEFSDERGPANR